MLNQYLGFIALVSVLPGAPAITADPREGASEVLTSDGLHHLVNLLVRGEYYNACCTHE